MSTLVLRKIMTELNRVNLDSVEMPYLIERFWAASNGVTAPIGGSSAELYFRVRDCTPDLPQTVDELGAPPAKYVIGYQRCNPPGQPMFYAASKRITALLESRVKEGDIVCLGHWVGKEAMQVNNIANTQRIESTALNDMFYGYIETIFTRKIHDKFNTHYKLTAAATEMLTTNFQSLAKNTVAHDRKVGLVYPSVANNFDGYNSAFHGDVAAHNLELLHVTKLKVTFVDESAGRVDIELLDNSNYFPDGVISWMNNPNAIPLPLNADRQQLLLMSNGVTWTLPVRDSAPNAGEIDVFLRE